MVLLWNKKMMFPVEDPGVGDPEETDYYERVDLEEDILSGFDVSEVGDTPTINIINTISDRGYNKKVDNYLRITDKETFEKGWPAGGESFDRRDPKFYPRNYIESRKQFTPPEGGGDSPSPFNPGGGGDDPTPIKGDEGGSVSTK